MILDEIPTGVPGLNVELFTRPDVPDGLTTLIEDLNASGVDGALSLHFNATPRGTTSPDRAYSLTYPGAEKAGQMADTLRRIDFGRIPRRLPHSRKDLAILSDTAFPVVLDEPAYIDRRSHRKELIDGLPSLAVQYAHQIERIYQDRTLSGGKESSWVGG
jgi:N-acetylmuramoyl-L-alanine amidase